VTKVKPAAGTHVTIIPELPNAHQMHPYPFECAELSSERPSIHDQRDSISIDHDHLQRSEKNKEADISSNGNIMNEQQTLLVSSNSSDGVILRGNMSGSNYSSIDGYGTTTYRGNVMDFMKYERGSCSYCVGETSRPNSRFSTSALPSANDDVHVNNVVHAVPPKPEKTNVIPPI
jgi:hypothetical protein